MQLIALQYAPTWLDKPKSHATVERLLANTAISPGALVVLPEMCDTGWSLDINAATACDTVNWAVETAARFDVSICVGFAERVGADRGVNCSVIAHADGSLSQTYKKMHPFSFGAEEDVYDAGQERIVALCDDIPVGLSICYDLRFPELYRHLTLDGAEVLTVIACWPEERASHWRALSIARAIENQTYVVAVNRVGNDPTFTYGGGSLIVSPQGIVVAEASACEDVITADVDRDALRAWRATFPALDDVHNKLLGR